MADLLIPDSDETELTDDQYRALLSADLEGNTVATAYLEQDVEEWYAGLVALLQDLESQFSKRKADAATFQNECHHRSGGKKEWFDYKADYDHWRGSANYFKGLVTGRLMEVKAMRFEQRDEQHSERDDVVLLRQILACLLRIEDKLHTSSGTSRRRPQEDQDQEGPVAHWVPLGGHQRVSPST